MDFSSHILPRGFLSPVREELPPLDKSALVSVCSTSKVFHASCSLTKFRSFGESWTYATFLPGLSAFQGQQSLTLCLRAASGGLGRLTGLVKNLPSMQEIRLHSLCWEGSIPGLGGCPGGGNSNPLQYSCLENPMNRGVQWATVHGVAKSWP